MPGTEENLMQAFAGESQANRKYLAFAEKAEKEGNKQVARLFRAAARAETVHAHNHLRALGGVKGTADNLREALGGETYEFENMYPPMIVDAEEEGNKQAVRTFDYASAVEKIHAALYKKALDELGNNEEVDYYVCKVCGNTVEGEPPDECPICGSKKSAFEKVE
jgi:rubrerythrin